MDESEPTMVNETQREKMWDELTDAEKIERMRGVVWSLQQGIQHLREKADQLERHQHGSSGLVLVPLITHNMGGSYNVDTKDRWF